MFVNAVEVFNVTFIDHIEIAFDAPPQLEAAYYPLVVYVFVHRRSSGPGCQGSGGKEFGAVDQRPAVSGGC